MFSSAADNLPGHSTGRLQEHETIYEPCNEMPTCKKHFFVNSEILGMHIWQKKTRKFRQI